MTDRLVIYVDVDDTLVRSVGTKRIPMPAVVQHVRDLAADGAELFCWSTGGATRHIGREPDTFPDRHYTVANGGLWQGGDWRGLRVEIEPRTRTFVAEMRFPTGNVLTAHGKQYTEVTRELVHLAVDA